MTQQRQLGRKPRTWLRPPLFVLLLLASSVSVSTALAANDHPARVSYLDGSGAYEAAGEVDWDEVTLNLPLFSGDRIFSHTDSRMEVELGGGNFLRISDETDVLFSELADGQTVLETYQGDLILRLHDPDRFLVKTPYASIKLKKKGLYRIRMDRNGVTEVLVRKGKAEVESQHGKQKVKSEQQVVIDGMPAGGQILAASYDRDHFDLWSDRRDASFVGSHSVSHVGGIYYPGIYELDRYGSWVHYQSYGRVWLPHVSVGWGPFRLGRWGYLSVGWTWLSQEPWGWLPYHYGNWIYSSHHHHWAWVPGGFHRWSPARVNFYFGGGHVGWAPWGHYRGRHRTTINQVVVNNNTINQWNSLGPPNALNLIRREDFGRGSRGGNSPLVTPTRSITRSLREGLPKALVSPVRREDSAMARSGLRRQTLDSRSGNTTSLTNRALQRTGQTGRNQSSVRESFSPSRTSSRSITRSRSATQRVPSPRVGRANRRRSELAVRSQTGVRSRPGPNVIALGSERSRQGRPDSGSGVESKLGSRRPPRVTSSTNRRTAPPRVTTPTRRPLAQRPDSRRRPSVTRSNPTPSRRSIQPSRVSRTAPDRSVLRSRPSTSNHSTVRRPSSPAVRPSVGRSNAPRRSPAARSASRGSSRRRN